MRRHTCVYEDMVTPQLVHCVVCRLAQCLGQIQLCMEGYGCVALLFWSPQWRLFGTLRASPQVFMREQRACGTTVGFAPIFHEGAMCVWHKLGPLATLFIFVEFFLRW